MIVYTPLAAKRRKRRHPNLSEKIWLLARPVQSRTMIQRKHTKVNQKQIQQIVRTQEKVVPQMPVAIVQTHFHLECLPQHQPLRRTRARIIAARSRIRSKSEISQLTAIDHPPHPSRTNTHPLFCIDISLTLNTQTLSITKPSIIPQSRPKNPWPPSQLLLRRPYSDRKF